MEELEARGDPDSVVLALVEQAVAFDRAIASLTAAKLHALDDARRIADRHRPVGTDRDLAHRAVRAEIACALRVTERAVDGMLGDADDLHRRLPATAAALAAGEISPQHARAIIAETSGVDDETLSDLEHAGLRSARTLTPSKTAAVIRSRRERRAPETSAARHRAAFAERSVSVDPARDGMAWLTAFLPAVEAIAIMDRVDATARALHLDGDPRGIGQLRADVVADILLGRGTRDADRFSCVTPIVVVTVPIAVLGGEHAGPHGESATLDGYGPIDPATARQLTSAATRLRRMMTDPHTGVALSLGRERYRMTDDLRLWLRLRDEGCRFPGCGRNARWCDVDHTRDWTATRGPTDHDNLAFLCRGHHTLKHASTWGVTHRAGAPGILDWTSPLGRRHTTLPGAGSIGAVGADPPDPAAEP